MATILQGDDATFSALALGEMHPGTQNYLTAQMEAPTHMLNEQGQNFFQNTRSLFERISESRSMRTVKAAQRAVGGLWQTNDIRHLTSIGDFQWAPEKMRRWIMAEPTVRKLFHQQRVEGYQGVYRDPFPDDVGEDHYDYRRATNGFVFVNEDVNDDEPEWTAVTYYDDLMENDRELETSEQADIVHSWANVRELIQQGDDDPTSRFNAAL